MFYKRDKFEFAFSAQAAYYTFENAYYYILKPASDKYPYNQEFNFEYHNVFVFNFNPALTFKFGFRNVKFIVQAGANIRSGNPFYYGAWTDGQTPFNSRVLEINTGIQFSFGGIKKDQG